MSSTKPVLQESQLEIHETHIAVLTLDRDDVRNAISGTQLISDIVSTLDWIHQNSAISVLVITAKGSCFSAGGNVKDMHHKEGMFEGQPLEIYHHYQNDIHRLPKALAASKVPVIAAINGHAVGVGLDLVCLCDLRISVKTAKFGAVFINLGLIPGDGGAYLLSKAVGRQRATEMILTGRLVTAQEALDYGLLLDVVESEKELMEQAMGLAKEIAKKSPQGVRLAKSLLKHSVHNDLASVLDLSGSYNAMLHHTTEHETAVAEFANKEKK